MPRERQDTLRVPPVVDGAAGRVAQLLQESPRELDDVSRARMERSFVQAWRTRAAAQVPLPRSERQGPSHSVRWTAALAACAVGVALLGVAALQRLEPSVGERGFARFELRIGDAAVQSGSVSEGQVLESGKHGHIDLDLGHARVDMARGTRVRFARISGRELRLSLDHGRIDVDFHPGGDEQTLIIESRAARVRVVGTRFSVAVDGQGNTEVAVIEGTVEVVPHFGGETRLVHAGERTLVSVDEGDAYERAVRSAIEDNLRADAAVHPAEADEVQEPLAEERVEVGDVLEPVERARVPGPAAIARRLNAARKLLRQGRHTAARSRLQELADSSIPTRYRAEALTLIAESYTAQGQIPRATSAYRRVVSLGAEHPAAHNAQFALARLLERYTDNRGVAAQAYRRYLELAPAGALAAQAREAVCRLDHCD